MIFEPIIYAPAFPNTVKRRLPIFMIALLIIVVYNSMFVSSSYFAAVSGSFAININFCIMFSIGSTRRVSILCENSCININKIRQMNKVFPNENNANFLLY